MVSRDQGRSLSNLTPPFVNSVKTIYEQKHWRVDHLLNTFNLSPPPILYCFLINYIQYKQHINIEAGGCGVENITWLGDVRVFCPSLCSCRYVENGSGLCAVTKCYERSLHFCLKRKKPGVPCVHSEAPLNKRKRVWYVSYSRLPANHTFPKMFKVGSSYFSDAPLLSLSRARTHAHIHARFVFLEATAPCKRRKL